MLASLLRLLLLVFSGDRTQPPYVPFKIWRVYQDLKATQSSQAWKRFESGDVLHPNLLKDRQPRLTTLPFVIFSYLRVIFCCQDDNKCSIRLIRPKSPHLRLQRFALFQELSLTCFLSRRVDAIEYLPSRSCSIVSVNLSTRSRIENREKDVSHCMRLSPTSIKRWKTRCGCVRMILDFLQERPPSFGCCVHAHRLSSKFEYIP